MAEYKNLSWSRVIKVHGFLPGLEEKYEIGPDLFSELQHMQAIDIDSTPEWEPLFDPMEFQKLSATSILKIGSSMRTNSETMPRRS